MGPLHLPVSDPPQADISKKAFHKTLFIFFYISAIEIGEVLRINDKDYSITFGKTTIKKKKNSV